MSEENRTSSSIQECGERFFMSKPFLSSVLAPIFLSPFGRVMEESLVHHRKALSPIYCRPSGKTMELSLSQPMKALCPMKLKLSGRVIGQGGAVKLLHHSKNLANLLGFDFVYKEIDLSL